MQLNNYKGKVQADRFWLQRVRKIWEVHLVHKSEEIIYSMIKMKVTKKLSDTTEDFLNSYC